MATTQKPKPGAASTDAAQKQSDADAKRLFDLCLGRAEKGHQKRCDKYKAHYQAYRGVLERDQNTWMSQLAPKYALQILETYCANLIDEHPRARVIPAGRAEIKAAEALTKILNDQRKADDWDAKVPQFVRQAAILGLSPAKVAWGYQTRTQTFRRAQPNIHGGYDLVEDERPNSVVMDRPTTEVIPAEDFLWDPSASRIDQCGYVLYRTWDTMEHLRSEEKAGRYRNVDQVQNTRGSTSNAAGGSGESGFMQRDTKNRIETFELWTPDRLIVVANRRVVLRDEANPYWHGHLPFIVATTLPDLYSLQGISGVELVIDLQAAIWDLLNQTIDNVKLANNLRYRYNPMTINPEDIANVAPGEGIPAAVAEDFAWQEPPSNILAPALPLIQELQKYGQDITGAVAYLSGAAEGTVDQKTATGISIVQNMAQQRLLGMRNLIYDAYRRKGRLEVWMNQQLLCRPIELREETREGWAFTNVTPEEVQGDLDYDVEEANESLNRQQRRQEALLLFQTTIAAYPVMQQAGATPNLTALYEDVLDAFEKENTDAYITQPAPQQIPGMPPGVPPQNGAAPPTLLAGGAAPSPTQPVTPAPMGPGMGGRPPFALNGASTSTPT